MCEIHYLRRLFNRIICIIIAKFKLYRVNLCQAIKGCFTLILVQLYYIKFSPSVTRVCCSIILQNNADLNGCFLKPPFMHDNLMSYLSLRWIYCFQSFMTHLCRRRVTISPFAPNSCRDEKNLIFYHVLYSLFAIL